jgi:hypothetical protein
MLEARHFTILTDHKPLTFAFHQKRDNCSLRQFNHLDFISQFTTDICHISGQDNIIADALSRVEIITAPVTHDAAPQSSCTATRLLANHAHTSRLLSAVRYSTPYIPSAIPELRQRLSSSPNTSCGQPFKKTAALRPAVANPASAPKFLATPSPQLATFRSLLPASYISTSTLSALYRPRQDFNTASRR